MSSIVTGDRYLEYLVKYVDRHAGPLLDGTLTLKLNPVGLHYVHSRIEALQELEGLLAGAPVDYLRAYVSDLGDHRALEQLRRILGLLTSLKVISVLPPPARDPTPVSLLAFGRLKVLELRGCDLSTSAARGLLELRGCLEKLICHNSTDALRHVFASRIVDIKDSPVWNRLSFVSCACNGLVLMDESLQLLPSVETLDLSRNQFAKVSNLRKCTKLQHLDLGFNHLRSIASLGEVSCRIVKLVLKNNALTTLRGIENLKSLEGLDLSYNIISSIAELEILSSLPCLQNLWLEGNPLCCARWYRSHVFSFFLHPEKLILDEHGISTREYWERHIILASRQKLPAGYGFYFPAKDEAEDEGCLNTKRKNYYRLANIEDEDQGRYLCSEVAEQESVSCDSDNQMKDENAISDGESEIASLMNKVEYMKKEQSVLWLREFKEWMDQSPDCAVGRNQFTSLNVDPCRGKSINQSLVEKLPGEISVHVPVCQQFSEGYSSSNILQQSAYHGNGHLVSNGKDSLEHLVVNGNDVAETSLGTGEVSIEQDQVEVLSRKPHNLSHLEVKASLHSSALADERGDQVSAPLTGIDEIMGSRPSSAYPVSPPHYQEDILQRRLYLEEEFLQLSAESQSLASSDSDTSCNEDDSCQSSVSFAEVDHPLPQESTDLNITDMSTGVPPECNNGEGRYEKGCVLPNHDNQFSRDGYSEDSSGCLPDVNSGQYDHGLEKPKDEHKHKRRIVSLTGNSRLCDGEPEVQRGNGLLEVREGEMRDKEERPSCNENYINESREGTNTVLLHSNEISGSSSKTISFDPKQDQFIKNYFHFELTDSGVSETCQQVVRCGCIYQLESAFHESEVALLRSCNDKLYLLQIDVLAEGQEVINRVLGFHRLEELREVVVGLGLQAVRVHMEGNATYVFLPRNTKKSKDLLCLLGVGDATTLSTGCCLQSWEQVQVSLLEKHICRSMKMGISFYSMLLFWHDNQDGESWALRSVFVVEGCLLVCIENLLCFSSLADDSRPPYYTLDSRCQIENIVEIGIEVNNRRCLTLILNNVPSGSISSTEEIGIVTKPEEINAKVLRWKLKWFSEETLLKFVAVLKAIHLGLTTSELPVKHIS
ncbi:uncharacterized protein LOC109833773 isoform X2 [Asparagus officinalis]|uniref:uncharacterized protein LOC109833773 isoform X2 n=1 Tax=Asparagus officinalis TaxID=4686 RepID=UPI00098E5BB1|nr:uncharacterized protein LOC109833773 isoform X2 [Asparagus officinalis]